MFPVLILVAGLAAPAAAGSAIEHQPLRCVVAGSHPWIEARAEEAVAVVARFRRADSRDWYTVRLADEGDQWTGALPPPEARVGRFVYYVEATDAAAHAARSAESTVRVVAGEAACGTDGVGPSVPEAAVVAEGPKGRPPLPRGFGQTEPVAGPAKGMFDIGPRKALALALGVGAGAAATVLSVANKDDVLSDKIEFLSATPAPGSVVSLSALRFSVRLRVTVSRNQIPGSLALDMLIPGRFPGCVILYANHQGLQKDRPTEIVLDRVLAVTCEPPFATQQVTVSLQSPDGLGEFSEQFQLGWSFVP